MTETESQSSTRTVKDAYSWENIPVELRILAPDKEPVVKGSNLDNALRRMFQDCKDYISCSMLKEPSLIACKARGKLYSKGYGGKENCLIYQAAYKSCKRGGSVCGVVAKARP